MQQLKLNVVNREATGRGVARRLRAEGKIPACVYSKGKSRSIAFSAVEFRDIRRSIEGAAMIELTDENGETAITHIQEIQRDIIKDNINHVDFHEVESGETFTAHIPVHLVGEDESVGVRNEGGVLDHKMHMLEIRCIPAKLPDRITVDVRKLAVGDAIHVGDLEAQEGVEFTDLPEGVIVSCQAPTVVEETTPAVEEETPATEVPASKVKSDEAKAAETKKAK